MSEEFETLKELVRQDRIKLGVHIRKMNTPGSPVYRPVETLWMPVLILVISFLGARIVNIHIGALLLVAGIAYWLWKVQPKVKDGVFARTTELAFSDERLFDGLWAKGALTLYATLPDGTPKAATRKHSWRDFAREIEAAY
ncbi:hypothetical protein BKE38_12980 [Pseudoroseomonas deserti]|uniref:Uncharacterized protein n=1 Tax=Teichococcus deserti TaxID=1817963 RepID=A0A1V2H2B6_9PROT|nr:hypothetical protein [Pseudoroseomonas deserti]ONG53193.1 hypothetical protein BKE38_12980 [Pseudoroseomonas deserti]